MISEQFDMNSTYFSTYFRSHIGISFYEYLTRIRLRKAIHLLNNTQMTIVAIALESGFPDSKALAHTFSRYFTISPSQYRQSLNKNIYTKSLQVLPSYYHYSDSLITKQIHKYLQHLPNYLDAPGVGK